MKTIKEKQLKKIETIIKSFNEDERTNFIKSEIIKYENIEYYTLKFENFIYTYQMGKIMNTKIPFYISYDNYTSDKLLIECNFRINK